MPRGRKMMDAVVSPMVKPNTEKTPTKAGTIQARPRLARRTTQAHRAATAPLSRMISKAPPNRKTKAVSRGAAPLDRASKISRGSRQGATGEGSV